jgi:hypothetical protein
MKTKNLTKNEFVSYGALVVIAIAAVVSLVVYITSSHNSI